MTTQTRLYLRNRYTAGMQGHDSHLFTVTGRLAVRLAEHFGIITGVPDGFDTAGRQKLRLMTPEEVVVRACSIAEKMVERLIESGDLVDVPEPPADKKQEEQE